MNAQDWKDKLGAAFNITPSPQTDETPTDAAPTPSTPAEVAKAQAGERLDIVLERHHRAGKQATIVTGFTTDDDAVGIVASALKKRLSVGGSARGGEILLQGDLRARVLDLLKEYGFKARII